MKSRSSNSKVSKKLSKLEQTLLNQDFAERVKALDRINKFQQARAQSQLQLQPSAPFADEQSLNGSTDLNPNHNEEAANEQCPYAELSTEDLDRPRGDFQAWERNMKKGTQQQQQQQQPSQKPPNKPKKPPKPLPVSAQAETHKDTAVTIAPHETTGKDSEGALSDSVDNNEAQVDNAEDEATNIVYASIIGVLKPSLE